VSAGRDCLHGLIGNSSGAALRPVNSALTTTPRGDLSGEVANGGMSKMAMTGKQARELVASPAFKPKANADIAPKIFADALAPYADEKPIPNSVAQSVCRQCRISYAKRFELYGI